MHSFFFAETHTHSLTLIQTYSNLFSVFNLKVSHAGHVSPHTFSFTVSAEEHSGLRLANGARDARCLDRGSEQARLR